MNTSKSRALTAALLVRLSAAILLLVGLSLLIAVGCGRQFEPYWRINTFRVLAIKADPVTLKAGQTATISALIHVPDGQGVTYEWDWCPLRTAAQDYYECPFTEEDLAGLAGGAGGELPPEGEERPDFDFSLLSLNLGTEETARLFNPVPADVILEFCREIQRRLSAIGEDSGLSDLVPVVDCRRGFEINVRLVATSGGESIYASKRLTLWTGSDQINHNPRLEAIQIRPAKAGDIPKLAAELDWVASASVARDDQWYTLPEDQPTPILADVPIEIRSVVFPGSIEMWRPPAPQGSDRDFLDPQSEVIVYRWMTSAGSLDRSELLFSEKINDLETASVTTLTVSKDGPEACESYGPECPLTLWSIVRDGRLGTDWIQRKFVVRRGQ